MTDFDGAICDYKLKKAFQVLLEQLRASLQTFVLAALL